jgi:pilus assembly protein CpaB
VSPRRRAAVLTGLSLLLGALAASDVARRQAAVERTLGPGVRLLVARSAVPAGAPLKLGSLARREVPARFAPPRAVSQPEQVAGLETRVRLPAGAFVTADLVRDPQERPTGGARPGERVAELVARGDPELIVPGSRVDVLVTRETGDGTAGRTRLALQDVEVLEAAAASAADGDGEETKGSQVRVSLRVTLGQAVYLAKAESFAREVRLLARAPGDRGRVR